MRLTRIIAALALLILLSPMRVCAQETPDIIEIGSFEELAAFSALVASGKATGAHVLLTSDIEATAPLRAIGSARHMFEGVFDGQGHVISRLIISAPSGSQGLFSCVGPHGVVKNFTLERAIVTGAGYVGGIAGYSAGRIEECHVLSSRVVNLAKTSLGTAAGGICGIASGRIADCVVESSSVIGAGNTGGVCGAFYAGRLENCLFSGLSVCTGTGDAPCGGVLGSLHGEARLKNCLAGGAVLSFLTDYTGGVVGGTFGGVIEQCAFYGAITSQGGKTGAVTGFCDKRAQVAGCVFDPYAAPYPAVGVGFPGTTRLMRLRFQRHI